MKEDKYFEADKAITKEIMKEFKGAVIETVCDECYGKGKYSNGEECINCESKGKYMVRY